MSQTPSAIYARVRRWLEEQRRAAGIATPGEDAGDDQDQQREQCGGPCAAFAAAVHDEDWIDPTPDTTGHLTEKV